MENLESNQIDCFNCSGTCCTFAANSMQITPLEAFEIILSLNVSKINIADLKMKLKKNIQHFRLDQPVFSGKKSSPHMRRTYTCPFFEPGPKGCTIKKELKPYGCLGFNPRLPNDNGSQCTSDQILLEERENNELQNELVANTYLINEFKIDWKKKEISPAVLELLNAFYSED